MAIATFAFWMGRHKFIHVPPHGESFFDELKSRDGLVAVGKLVPLFLFVAVFWCLFDQTASSLVFQAEKMDRHIFGVEVLPSQIQAANPFLILVLIPIFTWIIYPSIHKVIPLTPLRKIGVGLFLMTVSFAIISLAQEAIDRGETPTVWWQLLAYLIFTTAEILISIVCLEFAYTQSPRKMKSFVMGIYLLSVFAGNALTGIINLYIEIPSITLTDKAPHHDGFDGQKGTADDLTLEDKHLKSPAFDQLTECAAAIESIYKNKKSLPTTEKGNKALSLYNDPWGNPLRYTLISTKKARISSDGPDQKHLSQWDLGVMLKVKEADEDEKGTWLYREKKRQGLLESASEDNDGKALSLDYFAGGQTKLEGAAYFWFFTKLMLVTALVFIPFSYFYKTKTYMQE